MFCIKHILTCERAKNMGLFTQNYYFCCIQAGTKCAVLICLAVHGIHKLLAFKTNFCRACSLTLNQPLLKLIFEVDSGGRGGGWGGGGEERGSKPNRKGGKGMRERMYGRERGKWGWRWGREREK